MNFKSSPYYASNKKVLFMDTEHTTDKFEETVTA